MKSHRLFLFWAVMVGTIAFDQWIKAWVRGNLNQGQSWRGGPWHGVFEITLTYNKGIAFGMLQGAGLIMTPVAIIIAGVAVRTIYKNVNESRWGTVALALLASGALGNLYDRVFMKHLGVTDMFLLRLSNVTGGRLNDFPVFNVADSCISVAMVMLLISWTKQSAAEKAEPSLAQEPALEDNSL